jgi:hypothetical protein
MSMMMINGRAVDTSWQGGNEEMIELWFGDSLHQIPFVGEVQIVDVGDIYTKLAKEIVMRKTQVEAVTLEDVNFVYDTADVVIFSNPFLGTKRLK